MAPAESAGGGDLRPSAETEHEGSHRTRRRRPNRELSAECFTVAILPASDAERIPQLPERGQVLQESVGLPTSRAYLNHPAFPACTAMLAAVAFFVCRLEFFAHGDITHFIDAGSSFVNSAKAPRGLAIVPGSGYDGEFYYRLALDPANLHRTAFGITFDTAFRLQRITYSAIAWLFAGGRQGHRADFVGRREHPRVRRSRLARRPGSQGLEEAGRLRTSHRRLFRVPVLPRARPDGDLRMQASCSPGWLCCGGTARCSPGFLLAAAALSRETALAFAVSVGTVSVVEIARRRRSPGRRDMAWIIPGLLFVAWQIIGRVEYGVFPIRADTHRQPRTSLQGDGRSDRPLHRDPPERALRDLDRRADRLDGNCGLAGIWTRRSKMRIWELVAWVIACIVAVSLAPGIWRGEADFRGFEDLYVLSTVILLGSKRDLRVPILLVAVAWGVTFVHRAYSSEPLRWVSHVDLWWR